MTQRSGGSEGGTSSHLPIVRCIRFGICEQEGSGSGQETRFKRFILVFVSHLFVLLISNICNRRNSCIRGTFQVPTHDPESHLRSRTPRRPRRSCTGGPASLWFRRISAETPDFCSEHSEGSLSTWRGGVHPRRPGIYPSPGPTPGKEHRGTLSGAGAGPPPEPPPEMGQGHETRPPWRGSGRFLSEGVG